MNDIDDFLQPKIKNTSKLCFLILCIAVFEGAVRKWLSPELGIILMLSRDLFAFIAIILCLKNYSRYIGINIIYLLFVWISIVLVWSLWQLITNQTSFVLFIIGLRFWILYLSLAILCGLSMNEYELQFFSKISMYIAILIAPLVIIQFFSPVSSFVNKQLSDDSDSIFTVSEGIVRTTGTFTFTAGQSYFLGLMTPMVLNGMNTKGLVKMSAMVRILAFIAIFISVMLSGSRSVLLTFLIMAALYVLFEYFLTIKKIDTVRFFFILLIIIGIFLVPLLFAKAIEVMQARFLAASESEDAVQRILTMFFGEQSAFEKFKVFGYGIGLGSNFSNVFLTGSEGFNLAETEPGRVILEAGILGIVFILLKWLIAIYIVMRSLRQTLKFKDSSYLIFALSAAIAIIIWPISGQISANVLGPLVLMFMLSKVFRTITI